MHADANTRDAATPFSPPFTLDEALRVMYALIAATMMPFRRHAPAAMMPACFAAELFESGALQH